MDAKQGSPQSVISRCFIFSIRDVFFLDFGNLGTVTANDMQGIKYKKG